jgi:hypothetical protein
MCIIFMTIERHCACSKVVNLCSWEGRIDIHERLQLKKNYFLSVDDGFIRAHILLSLRTCSSTCTESLDIFC